MLLWLAIARMGILDSSGGSAQVAVQHEVLSLNLARQQIELLGFCSDHQTKPDPGSEGSREDT